MHHRVADLDVETEPLHRQCTDRREQGVRGDDAIVLRGDERNARVHQFLLGGSNEMCFIPYALFRNWPPVMKITAAA
jgi:hypothetical protein